jgi:hypothetical protein
MVVAQGRVTDQRGHVDGRLRGIDGLDIAGKARIVEGLGLAQQVHRVRRIALERDRRGADAAIADHHRGHALRQLGEHLRGADDVGVVMRMHVDEAGREHAAGGIDLLRGMPVELADGAMRPSRTATSALRARRRSHR